MNQDIKKRWVDALRSGDYEQTQERLVDPEGGYCCLGVLCEIAVQDGVVIKDHDSYVSAENQFDASDAELPEAVQVWAGLNDIDFSENPLSDIKYPENTDHLNGYRRPENRKMAHLSELNDDMGYDFIQIADVIDRVL